MSRRHSVTLLAPSGREQPVVLEVAREGVRLLTVEGREINTFAYETIRKWLPSHLRSKNPGTDDCLDLQIETDKGPRDLRMRCAGSMGVKFLMKDLRDTVEIIMRDIDDERIRGEGYATTPAHGDARSEPAGEPLQAASVPRSVPAPAEIQPFQQRAAPYSPGPAPTPSPTPAPTPGPGVAQLFVAHPTGVALPVTGQGVPTPALEQGLAVAANTGDLSSGTLRPYDYMDVYGTVQGASGEDDELTVTGRAPSAAAGFYNALYADARSQLPGYGAPSPPPPSPPPPAPAQPVAAFPIGVVVPASGVGAGGATTGLDSYPSFTQVGGPQGAQQLPQVVLMQQQPQQQQRSPQVLQQQQQVDLAPPLARGQGWAGTNPRASRPARRKVEFRGVGPSEGYDDEEDEGYGSDGRGSGGGEGGDRDLRLQVRFLEDLVAKLSTEVSRRTLSPERAAAAAMALAGADASPGRADASAPYLYHTGGAPPPPHQQARSGGGGGGLAAELEALLAADGAAAAALLRDGKLLGPLLAAYDERLAALEGELRGRTEQAAGLKAQVDEVIEENDTLRADLARAVEAREVAVASLAAANTDLAAAKAAAAAAAAAAPPPNAAQAEELALLRRENELLVAQQSELDGEIQRLHRQLSERSAEAMRHGQEAAAAAAAVQQANARAQDAESRALKLAESLRATEAKMGALAAQSTRHKAAADEQAAAAASNKAALEDLRSAHVQLQAEATAAGARYRAAADGAASLQLELSTSRERNDALQGQVTSLTRECDTLRAALSGVEAKLQELQRKDADVWSRVKEALSSAEEARLARDSALARAADLERQAELANTRLATVRQATREAVVDEFSAQVAAAQAAAAAVRDELTAAHAAASEWRGRAERLERDTASLQSELAALREDTAAALASKSRLGLASLGAVEKAAQLERERDEAVSRLESAQRKAERAARDAHMERQAYEATIRGLKSQVSELEAAAASLRAEAAMARRQQEAAAREAAAARAARGQAEAELRQQLAAVRSERDAEVRALGGRLEAAGAAAAAAAAEAERLLAAKQEVLARWREEAQTLASRMEAALSDHKREVAARGAEAADLRGRCEALAAENLELAGAVSELEGKVEELHSAAAEAEARADAALQQAAGAAHREADLQQELRNLQVLLDRTQFEKSRMQRANDPLTAKYDALKKDIRQAGGPAVGVGGMHTPGGPGLGWGGSPTQQQQHGYPPAHVPGDAVVHAVRAPRGVGGQGQQGR